MMSVEHPIPAVDFCESRPLVIILGPTCVGKTEIALQIAERLATEIISADSRLLYIGMDIGTAKPTKGDQARVRHHLIDVAPPDQAWSLAQYLSAAHQAIDNIHQRSRLPLLVGGTGQYIHAFTQGWKIPPVKPNPALRQALEAWASQIGYQALHDRLTTLDPQAARGIDPPNLRRTIRALEVIFSTGKRFSSQRERVITPYNILQVGISRPRMELYQRVDDRIQSMISNGFIDEVKNFLDQGYSPNLPTMSAIGYGEVAAYLKGQTSLEEAITLMKRRTRIFVRRQANWFKQADPGIRWFSVSQDTVVQIEQAIRTWLITLPGLSVP